MATHRPGFASAITELASALLAYGEVSPRARLAADHVAQLLPGCGIVVYVIEDQNHPTWKSKAAAGDVATGLMEADFQAGTLAAVADIKETLLFSGNDLTREDYGHLDIRRTVASIAYIPLIVDGVLYGAIEVISYDQPLTKGSLAAAEDVAQVVSPAIASALAYEGERNSSLQSISRVTQMYDLEKVFNSSLELNDLLAAIASKFQEVMNVQAVNVWMVDADGIRLTNQAGYDPSVHLEDFQKVGEGIAGDISDNGEMVIIDDPEDQRLKKRNKDLQQGAIFSLLASPLMERENLVGVVEVINRIDGLPFDEDDHFLLTNVCETANNALHNASLLLTERKLEILETLVKVSTEITSTLDLDRVLQAIVNGPGAVIPYERAAIALEQRGRLQIRAITGKPRINPQDPDVARLGDLLVWASLSNDPIFIAQHGEEVKNDREETRAKFHKYFADTGMRAFYAIPLADEEGRVGILSFESGDPDFLGPAHLEMIKVLAGQATVALRNASLYREVPFISLLEPVLQKKRQFLALEKRRRATLISAIAAALIFLAVFPLPLRVAGNASVGSVHSAHVQPEFDGIVQRVAVREGDLVKAGTVLATLADWEYRSQLVAAQVKYQTALSEMNRSLATNDSTEAGIQRIQADYWAAEVGRAKERLDKTQLRSPIDGMVATPHIENLVGRTLKPGDTFAEIVDTSRATVDVAIDQSDVSLLRAGENASVKLEGFPTRTFRGQVVVVSPKGQVEGDDRVFYARVGVTNLDGAMRPGMQGRGKIFTGWSPAGKVIFRRPAMWVWTKLWSWVGW